MRSKISTKGRVTIPREIRERLGLEPGDDIAFEITPGDAVILRRVSPDAVAYRIAISEYLIEWKSNADDEAFRHL